MSCAAVRAARRLVERLDVLQPRRGAAKARVVEQARRLQDPAQGGKFGVRAHVDGKPVVVAPARVHVVRRVPAMPVALRRRVAAVHGVVHDELAEGWQEAFRQRHFDELAFSGAVAVAQRHQHREGALHAGQAVAGQRFAQQAGRLAGVAAQVGVADHGLHVQAEGAVVAVRAVEREGRHAQQDEARVDAAQGFPVDAGLVHRLRGVVLHQHVAMLDEAQQGFVSLGGHDVAGHRAFVAGVGIEGSVAVPGVALRVAVGQARGYALGDEAARLLAGRHALHAARVGLRLVQRLDAHDVGAPLAQQLGDVRPGPHDGDFRHPQPGERQGERRVLGFCRAPGDWRGPRRIALAGVFVEQRGALLPAARRTGEDERTAGILQRSGGGMVHGVPDAARLEMGILQQVRHRVDGPRQQPCGLRGIDGVAFAQRRQPVGVGAFDGVDEVRRLGAHGGADLRVVEEVLAADQPQQARQAVGGAHDVHVAVAAGPHAGAHAPHGGAAAHRHARVRRDGQVGGLAVAATGLALVHRHVDPVALSAGLGAAQRHQGGDRRHHAGVVVGVMAGQLERFAVLVAVGNQRAAHGLQGEFRAAVVAVRPALSERRDRGQHQGRIGCLQGWPVPAPRGG